MSCGLSGNGLRPDSGKLGDLEDQFSADVTSVDHLMCAGRVLQRKHIDQRYTDKLPAKGLMRRSRIAADKPGDCRKENADGYSAHQHSDDALKRPQHTPVGRQDYVSIPHGDIAAGRKIKSRFPGR